MLPVICAIGAMMAILSLDFPAHQKIMMMILPLAAAVVIILRPVQNTGIEVVLGPEQSIKWRHKPENWQPGTWGPDCWTGSRYTLINCRGYGWKKRFLISRSLQDEETYTRLLVRIRLGGNELSEIK